jgi:predicted RNA binding protein YcfA (HicA-like mRNA interferase family)
MREGDCLAHERALLTLGFEPYLRRTHDEFGTFVTYVHRNFPWLVTIPWRPGEQLAESAIREIIRGARVSDRDYARAYERANGLPLRRLSLAKKLLGRARRFAFWRR